MTVRVGINGFGRIGRNFLRAAWSQGADLQVVALNDLTDAATNAHLLRYDTTLGRFGAEVHADEDHIVVAGERIRVLAERDPKALPWQELGVHVVVESTGRFTSRSAAAAHFEGGAQRVVISGPSKDADATFVMGVNDDSFDPARHVVVSNASCTTNCFVPMVKVLDDAFGVRSGLMTTVHAYTNDQRLQDMPHDNLYRARSAAQNIIPTSTGAASAIGLVIPELAGKLTGISLRVPVPTGSLVDLTTLMSRGVTKEEVNAAMKKAAEGKLKGILSYNEDSIVSTDIIGDSHSSIFVPDWTQVMDGNMLKTLSWYDNEWGYSCRTADLIAKVGKLLA